MSKSEDHIGGSETFDECMTYESKDEAEHGIIAYSKDGFKVVDIVIKQGIYIVYYKYV